MDEDKLQDIINQTREKFPDFNIREYVDGGFVKDLTKANAAVNFLMGQANLSYNKSRGIEGKRSALNPELLRNAIIGSIYG